MLVDYFKRTMALVTLLTVLLAVPVINEGCDKLSINACVFMYDDVYLLL